MKIINRLKEIKYPTVLVSQCKHFDIDTMPYGARYCPECNSIILSFPHFRKNFREIEEDTVPILSHETIHWWLCKNVNEEASLDFDTIVNEVDGGV
jgi:hypothetical protein